MRFTPLPRALTLALLLVACAQDQPLPPLPPPTAAASLASSQPPQTDGGLSDAGGDGGLVVPVASAPLLSPADAIRAAIAAPDRDDADRKLDTSRHPAELLSFFGITPGMKVGELVAGAGYTTELLSRVVGPTGVVWAENPPAILDRFAATPWNARMSKAIMNNVRSSNSELGTPFPPDAPTLDAVVMVGAYHETTGMKVDRAKMNRAVHDALAGGGTYGIVDGSAQSPHRIDAKTVIDEVTKAGFKLDAEGHFLESDFALRFVKQ